LPDPVGARINVFLPSLMASHPCSWAGVGSANAPSNQPRVSEENRLSEATEQG